MAQDLCAPFAACDDLDSRVLFQRSVYGPSLVNDLAPIPFGAMSLRSAAVRPYVDLHFQLRWVPRDLCMGPIASVMTLAPGETVTVATRSEHRTTFTDLARNATDSSSVSTHTRKGPDTSGSQSMGQSIGGALSSAQQSNQQMEQAVAQQQQEQANQSAQAQDMIELAPMYAKGYGSFWSDLGDVVAAVATGGASLVAGAVAKGVGDLVNNGVGSAGKAGAAVGSTVAALAEITDSISRSESQSHISESTHSTEDTTSTSVTRTFTNPYRDRTLQLRFMPVFRRFDAVVSLERARVGLAMVCGNLDFSTANIGSRYSQVLGAAIAEPTLLRLVHAEIGVAATDFHAAAGTLQDHLQANAPLYTKRFLSAAADARDDGSLHGAFSTLLARNSPLGAQQQAVAGVSATTTAAAAPAGDIAAGLAWSQSEVRSNVVHVPLSDLESVKSAWKLDPNSSAVLGAAVQQLSPSALGPILGVQPTQTLHLYAGSHIEAVPGSCLLPNIITDALSVKPDDVD